MLPSPCREKVGPCDNVDFGAVTFTIRLRPAGFLFTLTPFRAKTRFRASGSELPGRGFHPLEMSVFLAHLRLDFLDDVGEFGPEVEGGFTLLVF